MEKIDLPTGDNSISDELTALYIKYYDTVINNEPDITLRLELETKISKFIQKSNIDQIINFMIFIHNIIINKRELNTPKKV